MRRTAAVNSVMWDVQALCQAVRARLADLDVLAEAITDPRVARRVLIDQAVDLRRSLLDLAEQARRTPGGPGWSQPTARRDDLHQQVLFAAFEAMLQVTTAGCVLAAVLQASADAVRPLAQALVGQADMDEVPERSVTACRYYLLLADRCAGTMDANNGWKSPAGRRAPGRRTPRPAGRPKRGRRRPPLW